MNKKTNTPTQVTNTERHQHETIKAFFKKHKLPEELKQQIARWIGQAESISEVLTNIPTFSKTHYEDYSSEVQDKIAINYLRELIRTCNPNDNKFNAKKYGEAYQAGRDKYLRDMGTDLPGIMGSHIKNLKAITSKPNLSTAPITPKDYTAISKDIVQMVNLYQDITSAPQPNINTPLDMIPAETQKALPTTTPAIEEKTDEENEENKTD